MPALTLIGHKVPQCSICRPRFLEELAISARPLLKGRFAIDIRQLNIRALALP
jgi:hypothetical protein